MFLLITQNELLQTASFSHAGTHMIPITCALNKYMKISHYFEDLIRGGVSHFFTHPVLPRVRVLIMGQ